MVDNFIAGFMNLITFLVVSRLFFQLKKEKQAVFIMGVAFVIGIVFLSFDLELHWQLIETILIYSIFIIFCFKGDALWKMLYLLVFIIGSTVTELFMMKTLSMIIQDRSQWRNLIGLAFSNLTIVLLAFPLSSYQIFDRQEMPKYSWIMLILPITSVLLIFGIRDYFVITQSSSFLFIMIGLLLSNYISIFIYYMTIKEIISKNQLMEEIKDANERYDNVNKLLQQHNVFLHNIRKQSQDMLELLEKKQYSKLQEYISNVFEDSTNIYNMINSGNEIMDVIINDRLYIIKNNRIHLRIKLESFDFHPLDNLELENLLGYLIDLGIYESLSVAESRTLMIKSKKIGAQTILSVIFSSTQKIEDNHSFKEIASLLGKYNIDYLIENPTDKNQASLSVLFTREEN